MIGAMSDITDSGPRLRQRNDALEREERLRLTDEERAAVEAAIAYMAPVGNYDSRVQATLRGLLERCACDSDRSQPIATPGPPCTPAECTMPPEWMVANGYPQHLADQHLPCTFTACTDSQ